MKEIVDPHLEMSGTSPPKVEKSLQENLKNDRLREPEFFNNKIEEEILTKEQLSSLLKISIKTIDRHVSMKTIPFLKIGRVVRFERSEILAWAKKSSKGD